MDPKDYLEDFTIEESISADKIIDEVYAEQRKIRESIKK